MKSITIELASTAHSELLDITKQVAAAIPPGFSGLCLVYSPHTTGGVTLNENADPAVRHDLLMDLERLAPWRDPGYLHDEGNSAAHLKSSLVGFSQMLAVENGRLLLGTWQGIYFCEFDGPRRRRVLVKLLEG